MDFLRFLEGTALSTWIRESGSLWAYPGIITFHSAGLALMVGLSAVISLRLLGFAPGVPLTAMRQLFPAIWLGFWVNAISGIALIISDPMKMLTNTVFFLKMGLIAAAVITIILLDRRVLRSPSARSGLVPPNGKPLAIAALLLWIAATTAGRLTAYLGATVPL